MALLSTSPHHDVTEKKQRRIFTPLLYLLLWCGCIISQSMLVSGFLNLVISTVQVEYQLSSAEAAMFPSNYDITAAVTVLLVSHFGSSHKPRTLGIGMIVLACGSLLFALPNFLYKNEIDPEQSELYLCDKSATAQPDSLSCDDGSNRSSNNKGAFVVLSLGSILIGLGATPVYTAGTTFCDEVFPPNKVSMYFGISYGIGAIAPALGYILGGVFLGHYKTFGTPPNQMTPDNPNWVGAWWMGFILCAVLAFIFGLLLLMFPAQLPECEEVKKKKLKMNIQVMKADQDETVESPKEKTFPELLKEMFPLLKSVLTNSVFLLIVLGSICDSMIVSAFAAFLPKIVESQFGVSSSWAAYITGSVIVPGAAGGIMIGGFIAKWRKMNGLQCTKYMGFVGAVCILSQLALLMHCPNLKIDSVNAPVNETCLAEVAACMNCPGPDVYNPVCLGGVTYTSPCAAGCLAYDAESTVFSDCCGEFTATTGSCEVDCNMMAPFIVCLFFIMFFTFFNNIFFLTANLRCVKDNERIMAISLQSVAFRVFGSFPGPIILGFLFDNACILWNRDKCGTRGACQEYDNNKIMIASVTMSMVAKVVGTVFYFIAWRVWARRDAATINVTYNDEINMNKEADVTADNTATESINGHGPMSEIEL